MSTVHLAGNDVRIGNRIIQRCLVCGYKLIDHDLERVSVPIEDAGRSLGTFAVGHLICVSGGEGSGVTGFSDIGDTNQPTFDAAWEDCCINLVEY